MSDVSRRDALTLAIGVAGAATLPASPAYAATVGVTSGTKAYEHTFLKANAGLRVELGQYIAANWFVLDQKGLERGIFTSFWLLEETGENKAWDLVMVVGYPTELGYGDPNAVKVFTEIRKAHVEVKIAGKGLRDLGTIVSNHRLKFVQS